MLLTISNNPGLHYHFSGQLAVALKPIWTTSVFVRPLSQSHPAREVVEEDGTIGTGSTGSWSVMTNQTPKPLVLQGYCRESVGARLGPDEFHPVEKIPQVASQKTKRS